MEKGTEADLRKGVFISYSRKYGLSAARAVFQFLKSEGFDVFFDVEERSPGRFTEVILNQLGFRDHFVTIITPLTVDVLCDVASWPRRELQRALELQKNVVPVLLEGAAPITDAHQDPFLRELGKLNQLEVPHQFFDAAMAKLSSQFLRQPTLQELQIKIAEEHYAVADEAFMNEGWQRAIEEISLAINRNPRPDYYLMRAVAKHRLNDNPSALHDIDAALALDPSAFELTKVKFDILQNMGNMREALEVIRRWEQMHGYK